MSNQIAYNFICPSCHHNISAPNSKNENENDLTTCAFCNRPFRKEDAIKQMANKAAEIVKKGLHGI